MTDSTTKKSLADRIKAAFGLDDAGRVDTFLAKQVKLLNKAIDTATKNLNKYVSEQQEEIVLLQEQLEDANQNLLDCYEGVKAEDIKTNEKANEFAISWWDKIDAAYGKIDELQFYIDNINKQIKLHQDETAKNIAQLKEKIDAIS